MSQPAIDAVHACVQAITAELQRCGLWSTQKPSPDALASQQPFCVDTLFFQEWLQWIFIPRMQQLREQQQPLPESSGIAAMAEVAFAAYPPQQTTQLMRLLEQFDQLLMQCAQTHKHALH